MERRVPLPKHFNWRALVLRFLLNAVALAVTAIIVPQIYFAGDYRILTWLVISSVFGLLNAFVKPLVQFLMLPFLFVSYGLVVVVINSLMLFILALIFTDRFHVSSLLMAFLGGLVFGAASSMLENLLGLTPPIVEGDLAELRLRGTRPTPAKIESKLLAVTEGALRGHEGPTDVPPLAHPPAPPAAPAPSEPPAPPDPGRPDSSNRSES